MSLRDRPDLALRWMRLPVASTVVPEVIKLIPLPLSAMVLPVMRTDPNLLSDHDSGMRVPSMELLRMMF